MKNDLDRIDFAILQELQNDARLPNKQLASRVGLAPSSCFARVKRLMEEGVLKGAHADVDTAALGIGLQAMIHVRLGKHSREQVQEFADHALALPEVVALSHVAGAYDYLVQGAGRDAHHLRDLALDAFTTRDEVEHLETHLLFAHIRKPVMPCLNLAQ